MNLQHHVWMITAPEYGDILRNARQARAEAIMEALGCLYERVRRICGRFRSSRERRARYRALRALSDAELKDIGLGRSEILYAVTAPDFEEQRQKLVVKRPKNPVIGKGKAAALAGQERNISSCLPTRLLER